MCAYDFLSLACLIYNISSSYFGLLWEGFLK